VAQGSQEGEDQILLQILQMCTRCEDMYTDRCDQVIYQTQKMKRKLQLVPDEVLPPKQQMCPLEEEK